MLALAASGFFGLVDDLGGPWRHLVEALLLGLLALAFLAAASRSCLRRFPWLLSASAASGLAIAAGYSFVSTASTTEVVETGAAGLLGILLALACGSARAG